MAMHNNFRQPVFSAASDGFQSGPGVVPPPIPPRNYNVNNRYGMSPYQQNNFGFGNYSSYGGYGGMGMGYNSYGGYGSMGPGYGSYGGYGGGYGNYGGFSGYGGMGGYGSYGGFQPGMGPHNPEDRFIEVAQQSAQPIFDSFRSVMGMMHAACQIVDSSFYSVNTTFGTVLASAYNFSKLRSMLSQVSSCAGSVKRAIKLILRRLLYLVGLSKSSPTYEGIWEAIKNEEQTANSAEGTSSGWPILALFSLLVGFQYIIMKLVSRMTPETPPVSAWDPAMQPGIRGNVLHNFVSENNNELTIRRNQVIMIAPKNFQPNCPGWLLACDQNKNIGLVPANYITVETSSTVKTNIPAQGVPGFPGTSQGTSSVFPDRIQEDAASPSVLPERSQVDTASSSSVFKTEDNSNVNAQIENSNDAVVEEKIPVVENVSE